MKKFVFSEAHTDFELSFDAQYLGGNWREKKFKVLINGVAVVTEVNVPGNKLYIKGKRIEFFCKTSEVTVQVIAINFGMRNFKIQGTDRCGENRCCLP